MLGGWRYPRYIDIPHSLHRSTTGIHHHIRVPAGHQQPILVVSYLWRNRIPMAQLKNGTNPICNNEHDTRTGKFVCFAQKSSLPGNLLWEKENMWNMTSNRSALPGGSGSGICMYHGEPPTSTTSLYAIPTLLSSLK